MSNLIYLPIAIGILGGAFLGYWTSRPLAMKLSRNSAAPRLVLWCSAVGALLMALPALFLAIIVGGNLAGAWADATVFGVALASVAVPVGLAAGIAIIFGGGIAVGIVAGCLLGMLLAAALDKRTPTDRSSGTH